MATITVRVADETRDALERAAAEAGQTLSDHVRELLEGPVSTVARAQPDTLAPESLAVHDRHVLALLHRILARVLPEDSNDVDGDASYQLQRAEVLERGFTKEYWVEYAVMEPELSNSDCAFVLDVLDMFRIAQYSINELEREGTVIDEELRLRLTFAGFDHNDSHELQMSEYVRYLVSDGRRWNEQHDFVMGPEGGNSHRPTRQRYSRMLAEYRRILKERGPAAAWRRDDYLLTLDELRKLAGTA